MMGGCEGHEGRFEIGKGGERITILTELFLPEVDHLRFDKFLCSNLGQGRLKKEERRATDHVLMLLTGLTAPIY